MITLDHVTFHGPVPLHGRIVREIDRDKAMPLPDGSPGPKWEPHLHPEWSCVVVTCGAATGLVPLQSVASMVVAPQARPAGISGLDAQVAGPLPDPLLGPSPDLVPQRNGRPRTKRLGVVRD